MRVRRTKQQTLKQERRELEEQNNKLLNKNEALQNEFTTRIPI